jgi:hypothetical protein
MMLTYTFSLTITFFNRPCCNGISAHTKSLVLIGLHELSFGDLNVFSLFSGLQAIKLFVLLIIGIEFTIMPLCSIKCSLLAFL